MTGGGFVITEIYAYLAVHADGDEGVCSFESGGVHWPMVAADPKRLLQLTPLAKRITRVTGTEIRLVKFTHREEVEVVQP